MQNKDIFQQFKAISTDLAQGHTFDVIPIQDTRHKLGASKEGYPKFFICTDDSAAAVANTMLNILLVEYNLSCTFIDDNDKQTHHHYTVITLCSTDSTLQEYFIDIVILILSHLPLMPSKQNIAVEIEYLTSIFSAMTCPPRKKIQGLWAEMLVIEQSYMPKTLIKAWHDTPTAKYDFTLGRDKIEVKSTSAGTRQHHFSLDQLSPSTHSRVLIASMIARQSGPGNGGLSVKDLYTKIFDRTSCIEAQMHIYKVIAETMGTDIHRLNEIYFDYTEACDSLRFYDAKDVPGVNKDGINPGVSSVGFTSDLSGVTDIQAEGATFERGASPLYESLYK